MRKSIFSLPVFLSLLAAPASGQWFEGWVTLPDPLLGVPEPGCVAYDVTTNTLWVSGRSSDRVLVIQCDSNRCVAAVQSLNLGAAPSMVNNSVSATVFVASWDNDTVWVVDCVTCTVIARLRVANVTRLFHNPINNRVYCSVGVDGMVVVDGSTNQVLHTLRVWVQKFALDTRRNWLYCMDRGQLISIVDCGSDSVVDTIVTQRHWPTAVCYSSRSDKVYCVNDYDDTVQVFRRDTVLAEIRVGDYPVDVCYNPRGDKVYCANWGSGNVSVIDCSTDQVVKGIGTGGSPEVLVYDSLYDLIYCLTGHELVAIRGDSDVVAFRIPNVRTDDGIAISPPNRTLYYPEASSHRTGMHAADALTGDSIAFIPTTGSERPLTVCWDSATNKLYAACDSLAGSVFAIDGARNSVLTRIPVGIHPVALCDDAVRARIFCADSGSGSLSVIDCLADTVLAHVPVGAGPRKLLCLASLGKVYCANAGSSSVASVDAVNLTARTIHVGSRPWELVYSTVSDKLYCANHADGTVSVVAAVNDSVVRTIAVGTQPQVLAYSPAQNIVYCACANAVIAIDCATDSVVATIAVRYTRGIGYDAYRDWLYCSRLRWEGRTPFIGSTIVDCRTNSIIYDFDLPGSPSGEGWLEYGFNGRNDKMYCRANGGLVAVYNGASLAASFGTRGFGGGFAWNSYNNRMYAACPDNSRLVVLRDVGGVGVEDAASSIIPAVRRSLIVSGALYVAALDGCRRVAADVLLDAAGRMVMGLRPGANDVRHLSPGVYFVRTADGEGRATVQKVVITR